MFLIFQSSANSLSSMNVTRAGKWKKYLEIKRDFYLAYVRIISPNCCIYIDPLFFFWPSIRPTVRLLVRSFHCSLLRLFVSLFLRQFRVLICLFFRPLVRIFVRSFISSQFCLFVRLFITSFVCSFVHLFFFCWFLRFLAAI